MSCNSLTEMGQRGGERASDWVAALFVPINGPDVTFLMAETDVLGRCHHNGC